MDYYKDIHHKLIHAQICKTKGMKPAVYEKRSEIVIIAIGLLLAI
jgi:hypothetical protein